MVQTDKYEWLDQMLTIHCTDLTLKHKAILKSAVILFSEKGYASASTKDIANMAGVAEGTIFKHYSTKKDLLISITDLIISKFFIGFVTADLDEITCRKYDTIEDLLVDLMKNRLKMLQKGIPIFRILIQEIPFHPEIRINMMNKITGMSLPDTLTHIRDKGALVDLDDKDIILIVITCIAGFLSTRYIMLPELFAENEDYDSDADIRNFIQFMVRGLTK